MMEFLAVGVVIFWVVVVAILGWRVFRAILGPIAFKGDSEPADQSRQLDENVQFTVHSPREIREKTWYSMLVFAHLSGPRSGDPGAPNPVDEMQRQAARILNDRAPDYKAVTQDAAEGVPRQGMLTLVPRVDGVEFNPHRQSFRWEQDLHREEFQFKAVDGSVPRTARGRLTVFLGRLIIADVVLAIHVTDSPGEATAMEPTQAATGQIYQRIFASYSRADTQLVEEFERFVETLGHRYLRDVRDIRSGEKWSDRLEELIRTADVFQLFWSTRSMQSPFVKQEWEYALRLNRPHFVRPVYWESPFPENADLPPPSLKEIGFHKLTIDSRDAPATKQPRLGAPWFPLAAAVVIIGMVSALAVPALLQTRSAGNEASVIGRLRTMSAAQMAIHESRGYYADPDCLAEPATCLPEFTGSPFLPPGEFEGVHAGYLFTFVGYPLRPQSDDKTPSYVRWAYTAVPANPEATGRRTFCTDSTSRICQWTDGQTPRVIDEQCVCEPGGVELER